MPRKVRFQIAVDGGNRAIEEHVFDANMIVEILDIHRRENGAAQCGVNGRRGVRGIWIVADLAKATDFDEIRYAAAARDIGLEHVHGLSFD